MTTTRIEAELLIPGSGEPIRPGVVLLDDKGITYAGSVAAAPATSDASVVAVPVAMPGIWDAHIHLMGSVSNDLAIGTVMTLPAAAGARAAIDLASLLSAGVTSIREVGGYGVDLARVVAEGTVPGPSIYAAGSLLSTTGGHGDLHSIPLDALRVFEAADRAFGRRADGVPACLLAVREQLRRGARVIKVCASGGVLSEVDHPMHQQFSADELRAIVEEAARAERVVAAHCHGLAGITAALDAGVRSIEHGTYLDAEAAERMREEGVILVPTRFVVEWLLASLDDLPPYAAEKGQAIAGRHLEAMAIAVEHGVTIAAGTDLGTSGPVYGHLYAEGTREIRHLVEAGLSPLAAIEAATATGPLTLGPQGPRSGQLREGFDADVIALDGDPLADPGIWGDPARVTHVWKAGRLVKDPRAT